MIIIEQYPEDFTFSEQNISFYNNGFVTPWNWNRTKKTYKGAVYDQEKNLVQSSIRPVAYLPHQGLSPDYDLTLDILDYSILQRIDKKSIYLGHFSHHFGHFLLETISTFWIFDYLSPKNKILIFHPLIGHTMITKDFIQPVFKCFHIEANQILFAKGNSIIESKEIIIFSRQLKIGFSINLNMIKTINKIKRYALSSLTRDAKIENNNKIYLSRKNITNRSIENEEEIENIFLTYGFSIVYPETLSFIEQVAIVNNSEIIAGLEGSQMHLSMFMKVAKTVIFLATRTSSLSTKELRLQTNQILCNIISQVKTILVDFQGNRSKEDDTYSYDIDYLRNELKKIF